MTKPSFIRWPLAPGTSLVVLAGVLAAFVALRFPLMYRQPGGQDEEWYAVAGYAITRSGIPQVPYAPARDRGSAFYKADEALLALPPAYFYWQAPFHAAVGPGYFAARLASGISALAAIVLVCLLGRRLLHDETAALWGAGLYSLSRVFYFPATCARPDITCCALGLAAILAMLRWRAAQRRRWLVAGGALVGLGMLTHPFAVVYALQLGLWALMAPRGWRRRLVAAGLFAAAALTVFAAWLPLIALHPEVFRVQFFNAVLNRAGPGLWRRLLLPGDSLAAQSGLFLERAGPLQTALLGLGLLAATAVAWRRGRRSEATLLALAWSSVYLLAVCQGTHLTKEYWCYPGALLCLCAARAAIAFHRAAASATGRPRLLAWAGGLLLVGAMAPGSGVRTWAAHVRHWSDTAYSSPRFVRQLLRELPPESAYLVDRAYVLDFYIAGRRVLLAQNARLYFRAQGRPYDYLVAGPISLQWGLPGQLGARHWRTFGDRQDPFACFAEVYLPPDRGPAAP